MIDPFVLLTPILILGVIALLRFVGCLTMPDRPPPPIEVTFENPPPPGNPLTPLTEIYKNLDFGPSRWLWQGPTGLASRNTITFNTGSSSPAARDFSFANGPRVLYKMRVFVQSDNAQIRLTDGVNPPKDYTLNIADGLLDIATGWTMPAGTVTVSSSVGWNLGIDTIVYLGQP